MSTAHQEVDRALTLLRNKIRERGFTQLEVQQALSWGRSYISQLLTKQKALRLEQILLILNVIEVDPAEFFSELYHFPLGRPRAAVEVGSDVEATAQKTRELEALLRGLVQLLIDQRVIDGDEIVTSVRTES